MYCKDVLYMYMYVQYTHLWNSHNSTFTYSTCTCTCTCMPLPQYASELHVFIIHTVTFALYLDLKIAQDQLLDTKQELNQVTMKSGTEDKRIITLTDDLNTLQDQLSLLTVAKDKYMYDAVSQDLEESVSL